MFATANGTKTYFERENYKSVAPVELRRSGLFVSPVGFGSYRIRENSETHREALRLALRSGCNFIDTSTNYTDGSSERCIGSVLEQMFASQELERSQVVVVTKVGYLQGQNLTRAQARAHGGHPYSELLELGPDLAHCIAPEFIQEQITESLTRLKLKALDAVLLHNPEYFLKAGGDHAEYYRRIKMALDHLQTEVAHGRIARFGISSNTFGEPRSAVEYTSLETILEFAPPGFEMIQFPLNLFEPGPVFEDNNSGQTVVQLAMDRQITTLINRPLNAFVASPSGHQLIRLASFGHADERETEERLKQAFMEALQFETSFPKTAPVQARDLCFAHILKANFEGMFEAGVGGELDHWREVRSQLIEPKMRPMHQQLEKSDDPDIQAWGHQHELKVRTLFDRLTDYLESRLGRVSQRILKELDLASAELRQSNQTLSQKAIRIYRSLLGIDVVLVGMRRPEYVIDALALSPKLDDLQCKTMLISLRESSNTGEPTL